MRALLVLPTLQLLWRWQRRSKGPVLSSSHLLRLLLFVCEQGSLKCVPATAELQMSKG